MLRSRSLLHWKYPLIDQCFSDCEEVRGIDSEHLNRDPTDSRSANQLSSFPVKVLAPALLSWLEQPYQFAGRWISSSDVGPFMPITVQASQGEIIENRWPAMLARNDVVDVKW